MVRGRDPGPADESGSPDDLRDRLVVDVMSTTVVAVHAGARLSAAVDVFLRTGARHLVVVDQDGRPVGLLTHERVSAAWLDPRPAHAATTAELAVTRDVVVQPWTTVRTAARLMRDLALDAVPVVDDDGLVVGVLTLLDLVGLLGT